MISQDGQQGLARELARMNLPANIYTAVVLEGGPAQPAALPAPARRCPCAIRNPRLCRGDLQSWWPIGCRLPMRAFEDYRMGGATLSAKALDCIRGC
jgi:thymidylate synthase (FAD)